MTCRKIPIDYFFVKDASFFFADDRIRFTGLLYLKNCARWWSGDRVALLPSRLGSIIAARLTIAPGAKNA